MVLMKGCSLDMFLQEFVITSPDFEAAKFWVGNLGKTATHAVVYAQLYTPDHVCHGLHSFIVPVRPGPLAPHTVVSGVQILYLIVFRCAPGEGSQDAAGPAWGHGRRHGQKDWPEWIR